MKNQLKNLVRASLAAGFILIAGLANAACPVTIGPLCFHVTTFALPGFDGQLAAANDGGTAVGANSNVNAFIHPTLGLIRTPAGVFENFSDPNATGPIQLTEGHGINDAGKIVGTYSDAGSSLRGFILTGGAGGTFVTYDYFTPTISGTGTVLRGINNLGDMVGVTVGMSGGDTGFVVEGSTTTPFNFPGMHTNPVSVNDFREIVGIISATSTQGFYRSPSGTMSVINFPASHSTIAASINDLGIVGGNYIDSAVKNHGFIFVRAFNQYYSFDIPGSTSTNVASVTNGLKIWGNAVIGGNLYGYVLTPAFF